MRGVPPRAMPPAQTRGTAVPIRTLSARQGEAALALFRALLLATAAAACGLAGVLAWRLLA